MNANIKTLNAFRNKQGWNIAQLFSFARVLSVTHPPKKYVVSRTNSRHFKDLYRKLCDKYGERCSVSGVTPPGITLQIASKSGHPLKKEPKISEVRLLSSHESRLYSKQQTLKAK